MSNNAEQDNEDRESAARTNARFPAKNAWNLPKKNLHTSFVPRASCPT